MYNLIHNLFSPLNSPQTLYKHDHRERGSSLASATMTKSWHHEEQELVVGASARIGMEWGRLVLLLLLYQAVKFGLSHPHPVLHRRISRCFYLITWQERFVNDQNGKNSRLLYQSDNPYTYTDCDKGRTRAIYQITYIPDCYSTSLQAWSTPCKNGRCACALLKFQGSQKFGERESEGDNVIWEELGFG